MAVFNINFTTILAAKVHIIIQIAKFLWEKDASDWYFSFFTAKYLVFYIFFRTFSTSY